MVSDKLTSVPLAVSETGRPIPVKRAANCGEFRWRNPVNPAIWFAQAQLPMDVWADAWTVHATVYELRSPLGHAPFYLRDGHVRPELYRPK